MHHNNHDSKMMWWMMGGCLLLPLLLLLFGGRGGLASNWVWFSIIGVFIAAHVLMMLRGHGRDESKDDSGSTKPSETQAKQHMHEHN